MAEDTSASKVQDLFIYWDLENVSVPANISARDVVKSVREASFCCEHREREFFVVYDIKNALAPSKGAGRTDRGYQKVEKTRAEIIREQLSDAHVTPVDEASKMKNASDEKMKALILKNTIDRPKSRHVLISNDKDFAKTLWELRQEYDIYIVLVHDRPLADAMLEVAHETYYLDDLLTGVKPKIPGHVTVSNLPCSNCYEDDKKMESCLNELIQPYGGKLVNINIRKGLAEVKFSKSEKAKKFTREKNHTMIGSRPITVCEELVIEEKEALPGDEGIDESLADDELSTCNSVDLLPSSKDAVNAAMNAHWDDLMQSSEDVERELKDT